VHNVILLQTILAFHIFNARIIQYIYVTTTIHHHVKNGALFLPPNKKIDI